MRSRKDIETDFNNVMGKRREEFLAFQCKKFSLEVELDIREQNKEIIKLLKNNNNKLSSGV